VSPEAALGAPTGLVLSEAKAVGARAPMVRFFQREATICAEGDMSGIQKKKARDKLGFSSLKIT